MLIDEGLPCCLHGPWDLIFAVCDGLSRAALMAGVLEGGCRISGCGVYGSVGGHAEVVDTCSSGHCKGWYIAKMRKNWGFNHFHYGHTGVLHTI
jgi:hypothetical protein